MTVKPNLDNIDFKRGLLVGDMEVISASIGTFVNSDAGVRTFDVTLNATVGTDKRAKLAETTLKKIVNHPAWNPNYKGPDMWHPEERAMLYRREDIAIAVIKHPNFDKTQLPRVIATAEKFGSKKVLSFLKKQKERA